MSALHSIVICTLMLLLVTSNGATPFTTLPVIKEATLEPPDQACQDVDLSTLKEAFAQACDDAQELLDIESNLTPAEIISPYILSADARLQVPQAYSSDVADLDRYGKYFISATLYLQESLNLTQEEVYFGLKCLDLSEIDDPTVQSCNKTFEVEPCDPTLQYQTADGSCNNLNHPTWGKANTCYCRLLPPNYGDVVASPRESRSDVPLPLVRNISRLIHETSTIRNGNYTHMVMQFGQFLTHETSLLIMDRTEKDQSMLECCPMRQNAHPECLEIKIPENNQDFFYQMNQTCINFVRSSTCGIGCTLGTSEQTTRVTSYIDASAIYGNDINTTNSLRTFQGGQMKVQNTSDGEFPPNSFLPATDQCSRPAENYQCYETGDFRANQHIGITALQVIFLRLHNSAARGIQAANPDATDEELFQRSRRVVIALIQHISFNEYIPPVLGPTYLSYFDLTTGTASDYSEDEEVCILSEYGSAANRFGHAMVPELFYTNDATNSTQAFNDSYFVPVQLSQGVLEPVLNHNAFQTGKQIDPTYVDALTHELLRRVDTNDTFGLDMASIDIQRGRDHGTDSYVKYLQRCFNLEVSSFEQLGAVMSEGYWKKLQIIYNDVNAIDLITGALCETSLEDGIVGPTFGCIIGIQFRKFKFGDRFYYENQNQIGSFNEEQLAEIRRTSFAQIICENSFSEELPPNVFQLSYETNIKKKCSDFNSFNYALF